LIPQIYNVTRSDLVIAAGLLGKYPQISPRDALHVAVMRRAGIKTIYSTDTDFDAIEGIERVEPVELLNSPR